MRNQALIHDVSFVLSLEIVGMFELVIDDEERERVWAVVYTAIKAGIEKYETMADRRAMRLGASDN